jgi:cbb3-type cytochrome oxidase maturation protein
MEVLFLLIGVSICVAIIFLFLFVWALRSGQYDDSKTPSIRMLFDNYHTKEKHTAESQNGTQ